MNRDQTDEHGGKEDTPWMAMFFGSIWGQLACVGLLAVAVIAVAVSGGAIAWLGTNDTQSIIAIEYNGTETPPSTPNTPQSPRELNTETADKTPGAIVVMHEELVKPSEPGKAQSRPKYRVWANVSFLEANEIAFQSPASGNEPVKAVSRTGGDTQTVLLAGNDTEFGLAEGGTGFMPSIPMEDNPTDTYVGQPLGMFTVGKGETYPPINASGSSGLPYISPGAGICNAEGCTIGVTYQLNNAEEIKFRGGEGRYWTDINQSVEARIVLLFGSEWTPRGLEITATAVMESGDEVVIGQGTIEDIRQHQFVERGPGRVNTTREKRMTPVPPS